MACLVRCVNLIWLISLYYQIYRNGFSGGYNWLLFKRCDYSMPDYVSSIAQKISVIIQNARGNNRRLLEYMTFYEKNLFY